MKESPQPLPPARPRLKPYPAYKDSGVEWLGEIPAQWKVRRLRSTVTSCQNGVWGDEPDGAHDIPCVRVADFDRVGFRVDMVDPTLRSIEQRVVSARRLRAGDLLLEKSGGGERQPVGAVVLYGHDIAAVCSNFVARLAVVDGYSPRFLTYLHAALYALRVNTRHIKQSTGIQNLDSASYLSEATGLPDAKEQRDIAAFLDRETAKIDAMVAKKERLIELLQEKRAALITRAVTKGLDPDIPMKDSGVEWLGEIPAHWKVKRLKHLAIGPDSGIQMGPFGSMLKELVLSDTGYKLYGQENTISGNFDKGSRWLSERQYNDLRGYWLRSGDIVVTRKGSIGNARIVPGEFEPGMIDSDTIRIRVDRDRIDSRFLVLLLHEGWYVHQQLGSFRRGAVLSGLNTTTIADLVVAVPPRDEQGDLLRELHRVQAGIDGLIVRIREAIDHLKELRTALIFAAVTGKIDVREEST